MILKYNNQVLFCSSGDSNSVQDISGSLIQLSRIQDYSLDISYPYYQGTDLNNNTILQAIARPSATLGLNYYPTNLNNELVFGFTTGTGQGAFSNLNSEKNFYVRFSREGYDAINSTNQSDSVLGFGNGVINSYSLSTAVGNPLQGNINWEFLEIRSYTGVSGQNLPSFDHNNQDFNTGKFTIFQGNSSYQTGVSGQNIAIIAQKDLALSFSTGNCMGIQLTGENSCYLQNFNLALNFNRAHILELGKKYPTNRDIIYPIEFDFSVEAVLNTINDDATSNYFCTNQKYNILLNCKKYTSCSEFYNIFNIAINGLKLERQTFNANLSGPNTVSLSFKGLIANNFDLNNNIFII